MITPQQEKFIELYLSNEKEIGAAYKKAGYTAKNTASAAAGASRLLKRPDIQAAIEARRQKLREAAHMSRMDVVGFLCDTIKTPVGEIDENHKLAQEHSAEESESRSSSRIKMPSKLEAVKILVGMMGWNEPEKHSHTMHVVIGGNAE